MVDIAIGQEDRLDRAVPQPVIAGVQRRRRGDLLAQIRRGIDQEPGFPVGRNREARLGPRLDAGIAGPGQTTHRAAAVPLGNTAARCRAENDGLHG